MKKLIPILLACLMLSGCYMLPGAPKSQYMTPAGQIFETTPDIAYLLAQRDAQIASEVSFNTAIKGASDFQSFGLTVNKLVVGNRPLQRLPTWDERALPWVQALAPWFAGGIANQRNHNRAQSTVYNINGDNNNMSGIANVAKGGDGGQYGAGGSVTQDLTVNASPYYYRDQRVYSQSRTGPATIGNDGFGNTTTNPGVSAPSAAL